MYRSYSIDNLVDRSPPQEQNQGPVPVVSHFVVRSLPVTGLARYRKDKRLWKFQQSGHRVTGPLFVKLTCLADAEVDGRAAFGVLVGSQQMYFNKEAYLLVKQNNVTYGEYKYFNGIPIAQEEHDGHFEPRITDFRVVDKFDPVLFEKPRTRIAHQASMA
jgi:hypothetical protein